MNEKKIATCHNLHPLFAGWLCYLKQMCLLHSEHPFFKYNPSLSACFKDAYGAEKVLLPLSQLTEPFHKAYCKLNAIKGHKTYKFPCAICQRSKPTKKSE